MKRFRSLRHVKELRLTFGGVVWALFLGLIAVRLIVVGLDRRPSADSPSVEVIPTATTTPLPSPTELPSTPTMTRLPTMTALPPTSTITPTPAAPTETPTPTLTWTPTVPLSPTPFPVPSRENMPRGAIGRIVIPAIDRDALIFEVGWHTEEIGGQKVAVWDTLSGAVGHHRGSAPLGGPGNTVLSGHTGGKDGGVFRGLWDLQPGDEIWIITREGQEYLYIVEEVFKLQEVGASLEQRLQNARYMDPTEDDRLTLITCWPEWAYTHRVVAIARPYRG